MFGLAPHPRQNLAVGAMRSPQSSQCMVGGRLVVLLLGSGVGVERVAGGSLGSGLFEGRLALGSGFSGFAAFLMFPTAACFGESTIHKETIRTGHVIVGGRYTGVSNRNHLGLRCAHLQGFGLIPVTG
jgi:hypothetical protein